jgi:hypothetical protein
MTVKKYFERLGKYQSVTFIKARARKDANTPFYHDEYQTTPCRTVNEWLSSDLMDYIILNDKQMPIDWLCGAPWGNQVKAGCLKCLLVISREDAELLYSKEQFAEMEEYIDEQITGA